MIKRIFSLLILIIFIPMLLVAEDTEDRPITEIWKDILLFGIDSEVIKVIDSIKEAKEDSLNEELLEVFKETVNIGVRKAILNYFGQIQFEDAKASVYALLSEEDLNLELVISSIHYIANIKPDDSEEILIPFIDSDNQNIASVAVNALGKAGSLKAGSVLLEKLNDDEYPEKLKPDLIVALGDLKHADAFDTLINIIQNKEEERIRRMYAAVSLGKIGDERSTTELKKLFYEKDSLIKMYAASALSNFNMSEVQDVLIQGLRDSNVKVRIESAKALAHKDAKKAVKILIYKAKYDPEKKLRIQAIKTLGEIGTDEAYDFIREMLRDKIAAHFYRETALDVLCEKNLKASLKDIKEIIEEEWGKKDTKVLEFIAKRIVQVEVPELKDIFARFLESNNFYIRIYGIRGIGLNQITELKSSIQKLSEEDPHPAVRRVALAIYEKL